MKLKKMFALFLALLLMLTMTACSGGSDDDRDDDADDEDEKSYLVCPECDKKCDADAAFCAKCGSSLAGEEIAGDYADDDDYDEDYAVDTSYDDGDDWEDEYANVDCFECYDNGYDTCQGHKCSECEGKGAKKCPGCKGTGAFAGMECFGCEGTGETPCFLCGKTGTLYHKYTELPDSVTTTPIPERTTAQCDKCEKGKITCPLCEGTGRFGTGETPSYGGGGGGTYDKLCSQCHGAKKIKCQTCGGDAILGN